MAVGYTGKILYANLNDLTFSVETKDEYFYRTFMGGSAMASYFLLTEMEKGVDALGPENVLVVTTSILTGTPLPGANRYTVAAKSPLNDESHPARIAASAAAQRITAEDREEDYEEEERPPRVRRRMPDSGEFRDSKPGPDERRGRGDKD